jgi:hypothetical protein
MQDLLRFRRCRDLHGNEITLTIGRRNGKSALFFRPQIEDPEPAPEPQELTANPNEVLTDDDYV